MNIVKVLLLPCRNSIDANREFSLMLLENVIKPFKVYDAIFNSSSVQETLILYPLFIDYCLIG